MPIDLCFQLPFQLPGTVRTGVDFRLVFCSFQLCFLLWRLFQFESYKRWSWFSTFIRTR